MPCERVNCPSQTFASQYRSIPIYNIDSKLIEKQEMTEADVNQVKDLYLKADVVSSCQALAQKFYQEAKEVLNKLKLVMNESEFEFFEDLLNFVINRKF